MAATKCPHCDGTLFETKEAEPQDARYKAIFIQCSGCGTPFAALDYHNTAVLLEGQKAQIAELSQKVDQLDHKVRAILQAVQR